MKFKVGDLVWVKSYIADPGVVDAGEVTGFEDGGRYIVEIYGKPSSFGDGQWSALEEQLSHRRPPDEIKRQEVGSWNLCPWQPKEIVTHE